MTLTLTTILIVAALLCAVFANFSTRPTLLLSISVVLIAIALLRPVL